MVPEESGISRSKLTQISSHAPMVAEGQKEPYHLIFLVRLIENVQPGCF